MCVCIMQDSYTQCIVIGCPEVLYQLGDPTVPARAPNTPIPPVLPRTDFFAGLHARHTANTRTHVRRLSFRRTAMPPPAYLPDHFADDDDSRSWFGVSLTICGLGFVLYFFGNSLQTMIDDPRATEISVELTHGTVENLTLMCNNALGCDVRHVYGHRECSLATTVNTTMAKGETLQVQLCGSLLFGDGVHVTTPLPTANVLRTSPLAYKSATIDGSGGREVQFPHTPLSTLADPQSASAIEMDLTAEVNEADDSRVTHYWAATNPYPAATTCDGDFGRASTSAAVGGGLNSTSNSNGNSTSNSNGAATLGLPGRSLGALPAASSCYIIQFRPTMTVATTRKAFSLFNMLEAWGAAYSFVFGLLGYFVYWVAEKARVSSLSRTRVATLPQQDMKAEEQQ